MSQRNPRLQFVALLMISDATVLLSTRDTPAKDAPSVSTIDPRGRPAKSNDDKGIWTAVWYEDAQWHLRCNGPDASKKKRKKEEHIVFAGTVTVTVGAIIHGDLQGLEKQKKRGPEHDWVEVHPGNRGFDFHFGNSGRTDGLDFKVSQRTETITFKLLTGDNDTPEHVIIGKDGKHPDKIPFTLPANPDKDARL